MTLLYNETEVPLRKSGLFEYLREESYRGQFIRRLVVSIHDLLYVIASSDSSDLTVADFHLDWTVTYFLSDAFAFLTFLGRDESDALSGEVDVVEVWREIYVIFNAFQGFATNEAGLPDDIFCSNWKVYCRVKLPTPDHAKMRNELIQLEDTHGDAVREQFPPERWGKLSLELGTSENEL